MFLSDVHPSQTGELCIFTGHEAGKLNTVKEKHFTIVVSDDWLLVGMKLSLLFEWKNEHLKHMPFPMVTEVAYMDKNVGSHLLISEFRCFHCKVEVLKNHSNSAKKWQNI